MKSKKILTAALLLPVTLLAACAALTVCLFPAGAASPAPVAQAVQTETCVGIPIELALHADDPDGDIVLYQLTEQPQLGTASISGNVLRYAPGKKAGKDTFSFTAVDVEGRTAAPARITVRIWKNKAKLTYADMTDDPAHYAALRLSQAGVMTGEQLGGCFFFRPAQPVTRAEFIAMSAALAELPLTETAQTDFADDGGLSPWAKPFISTAAADGLISGYPTAGDLPEIRGERTITLAEASVVLDHLLQSRMDGAQYTAAVGDEPTAQDWASRAVSTLARLEVASPAAAAQRPDTPLTRRTACELLYRTLLLVQG